MEKEILLHKLVEVQNYFKQEKEKHYLVACKEEHLQCFAESLVNKSSIVELNAPYFEEEIAIDRRTSVDLFSFLKKQSRQFSPSKLNIESKSLNKLNISKFGNFHYFHRIKSRKRLQSKYFLTAYLANWTGYFMIENILSGKKIKNGA